MSYLFNIYFVVDNNGEKSIEKGEIKVLKKVFMRTAKRWPTL